MATIISGGTAISALASSVTIPVVGAIAGGIIAIVGGICAVSNA